MDYSFKQHSSYFFSSFDKQGDFSDAKASLRIALFVIGNSCPRTFHGQLASFLWKCTCHMLYQLGALTILETVGNSILPGAISCRGDKEGRQFAAKLSAKAYKKLHEISIKGLLHTFHDKLLLSCNLSVSYTHLTLPTIYSV